ncbi:MAG: inositol monophosphatase family protein [Sulfuricurvum sp.]
MNTFIAASIQACSEIRTHIALNDPKLYEMHQAGYGGDISSGIDLIAEEICHKHLHPFGSLFSEESGWLSPPGEINIICDPLDGSDNFASGFPYFGISIAKENAGTITEAIVCNLSNGECFIRTETEYYRLFLDNPENALLVDRYTVAKVGIFEKSPEHPVLIQKLIEKKLKFRSPGALALSLAYAPYVNYVLFLGTMRPYDIEAGLFLSRHLNVHRDDRYILICADKQLFEEIRFIVEKEYY